MDASITVDIFLPQIAITVIFFNVFKYFNEEVQQSVSFPSESIWLKLIASSLLSFVL